jgi:hypothetical protein
VTGGGRFYRLANTLPIPQSLWLYISFFWLRWFVTGLGFVSGGKLVEPCRTANETLRFGAIMFIAPISVLLELGYQGCVAQWALSLRDAMLDTPPTTVTVVDVIRSD